MHYTYLPCVSFPSQIFLVRFIQFRTVTRNSSNAGFHMSCHSHFGMSWPAFRIVWKSLRMAPHSSGLMTMFGSFTWLRSLLIGVSIDGVSAVPDSVLEKLLLDTASIEGIGDAVRDLVRRLIWLGSAACLSQCALYFRTLIYAKEEGKEWATSLWGTPLSIAVL